MPRPPDRRGLRGNRRKSTRSEQIADASVGRSRRRQTPAACIAARDFSNHQCSLPSTCTKFANALAPRPRLVDALAPLPAIEPQPVGDHPLPHGLAGERKAMLSGELIGGERRIKIGIVLAPILSAASRTAAAVLGLLGRPRFLEIKRETPATRNAFNNRHSWRSLRSSSCAATLTGNPQRSTSRNTARRRSSTSLTLSTVTGITPYRPPNGCGD